MNEILLDPKDLKIAKLKQAIECFKKYDKERKEYYKEAMLRLGEYESLLDEASDCNEIVKKLRKRVKYQKDAIRGLERIIAKNNIPEDIKNLPVTDLQIALYNKTKELCKVKEELKALRKTNSDLICRIVKLQNDYDAV